MATPIEPGDVNERDVATAIESLKSGSFKSRFVRTDCNTPDPEWKSPDGQPIKDYVGDKLSRFRKEVDALKVRNLHGGVLYKIDSATIQTVAHHHLFDVTAPTPRDLFHVYGPDRDSTGDWSKYYRFAWKDKGPNGIIFSTDAQIIKEGKLGCNSYAYSGQSSFALVGAGIFFIPYYGNAKISIRPYVQWLTSASFTGTESAPASAAAFLGIFVESWARTGGNYSQDVDQFIPVWSQNTQNYITGATAAGAASVGDGLAVEMTAATNRKYSIYVYAYLETSAAPPQAKNELRFTTIDIDATVPYVVVEEKLI